MKGKVALVTGGGSGIGRETALEFARRGAMVVVANRGADQGEETVDLIKKEGGVATFIKVDVEKSTDIAGLLQKIEAGYHRLDYAFNCAGYFPGLHPLAEYTEAMWDKTMSVNAKGTWLCLKYEIPLMLKHGGGAIVNASSVASLLGIAAHYGYTASKAAINAITRVAAIEFASSGVRVNAVCPGVIETPMVEDLINGPAREAFIAVHPIGRFGKPGEIAKTVVWLCSDEASFITGQILPIDGGWSTT